MIELTFLAQAQDFGTDRALGILQNHSFISNSIGKSFQTLWDNIIFDTTSSYWRAVVAGALDFSLLGILLFAWTAFKTDSEKLGKLGVEAAAMVLILAIMLGGNGVMTSNVLHLTRAFDVSLTRTLAQTQLLDITIADALKNISLTEFVETYVNDSIAECQALVGDESLTCLQQEIPKIEEIAFAARVLDPVNNSPLSRYIQGLLSDLGTLGSNVLSGNFLDVVGQIGNRFVFGNPVFKAAIRWVFGGIQLAFNFGLEVAGILHALLLPLVVGIIFTPVGPKYLETWTKGYVQLVLVKFLYVAVIGLVAEAIVLSESQFLTGTSFTIFSSVLGPALAFYMAKGGGEHMAKFISSQAISSVSSMIRAGTTAATGGAGGLGGLAGKGIFKFGAKGLARRTVRGR